MSISVQAARQWALDFQLDATDADVLLCHVLGRNRSYLYAFAETLLTAEQEQKLQHCYQRRQRGEPVAYITGVREFWSLPLQTSVNTLIPRPDTELLVETILSLYDATPRNLADLGTGTGAIALAIKSERPGWQVHAVDRIAEAVALAQENARQLALDVTFNCASWCDGIESDSLHILVSNPPYIDATDIHLSQGDVRFEPESALVADDQGLADIKIIARQGLRVLRQGGGLFLEHGWQQGEAVRKILSSAGYRQVETRRDYGDNDRVTFGFRP